MEVNDDSVYRKHRDDLLRYAAALVGPHRAEDVLSATVVRVLARGGFERLRDPRPYLFRAVLNEARNTLSRNRSGPLEVDLTEDAGPAPDPDVLDAVLALPPRQRAAVYLVYWQGETVADAAQLMHCRPGTVKRYLHLARQRLKEIL
jgi:RNA polymerase sigma-70 factor (ECF subfamily)